MDKTNSASPVSLSSLTSRLRKAEWRVTRIHGEYLRQHGVNMYQAMSLIYIATLGETETVNQRSIEKFLYLSNPGVSKIISHLEQQGYVRRETAPSDARSYRLIATEEGVRFARVLSDAIAESDRVMLSPLSDQEQLQLLSLLARIGDAQTL